MMRQHFRNSALKGFFWFPALVLLFSAGACKKDEASPTPIFTCTVTYTVGTVGEAVIDQIFYTDGDGNLQMIENERDWNTFIKASSGSTVELGVTGRLFNGAVYIDITAQATGLPTLNQNMQDGFTGGGDGKPLDMEIKLKLE